MIELYHYLGGVRTRIGGCGPLFASWKELSISWTLNCEIVGTTAVKDTNEIIEEFFTFYLPLLGVCTRTLSTGYFSDRSVCMAFLGVQRADTNQRRKNAIEQHKTRSCYH